MSEIRRLFVTGAGTGLGLGLADHYARAGAHLGIVGRR
jgi:short-subunit dehydrogenase